MGAPMCMIHFIDLNHALRLQCTNQRGSLGRRAAGSSSLDISHDQKCGGKHTVEDAGGGLQGGILSSDDAAVFVVLENAGRDDLTYPQNKL